MTVVLNGKAIACNRGKSLTDLLIQESIDMSNLAIAVDDIVISRAKWADFILKDNSKILLIKATQGG